MSVADIAELTRARKFVRDIEDPSIRPARPVGDRLGPPREKRRLEFFPAGEHGVYVITTGRESVTAKVDNTGRVQGIPELGSDVCSKCPGRCCTWAFGFSTLALTPEESKDPLFAPHVNQQGQLPYVPGHGCPFMAGGKCTIYDRRPSNCRGFMCYNHNSAQIKDAVNAQPALRKMLREEGVLPEKSHRYESTRQMLVSHRQRPVRDRRQAEEDLARVAAGESPVDWKARVSAAHATVKDDA